MPNNMEYWLDAQVPAPEAIKVIKRQRGKGMALFVSAGQLAPIAGTEDRVFPISGNVRVTQAAAIAFVEGAYRGVLTERGALVALRGLGRCLFIGNPA